MLKVFGGGIWKSQYAFLTILTSYSERRQKDQINQCKRALHKTQAVKVQSEEMVVQSK